MNRVSKIGTIGSIGSALVLVLGIWLGTSDASYHLQGVGGDCLGIGIFGLLGFLITFAVGRMTQQTGS
jgi:hypothetical protein